MMYDADPARGGRVYGGKSLCTVDGNFPREGPPFDNK